MLKRIIKIAVCIIAVIVCACTLSGCVKYNAEMDSYANPYVSVTFVKETESNSTFIFTEKEEFDKVFTRYEGVIDFDKKMVLLYIFFDCYQRNYYLKSIDIKEQVLTVQYKLEPALPGKHDAVQGYKRCLMVTLDKQDITSAQFLEK